MKTELFDFHLPEELIASEPANPRDASRMLVVGKQIEDKGVRDLLSFLHAGDIMVFNDSKVIPARLLGKRGDAKIEILLHKREGIGNNWKCFAKPAKRIRIGDTVSFAENFFAKVLEKHADGQVLLKFDYSDSEFWQKLDIHGLMPLPPYIEKMRKASAQDSTSYQTVYAKNAGSVAAPTAGLHFTDELLKKIDELGVKRVHVTLHVGGGTFLPVKAENTKDHIMHSEFASITKETVEAINNAKKAGGRVIAIGTTSVRTLESAADEHGNLREFSSETNIFITPSYKFKVVDMIFTNFHLPKSTLFMLVSAFAGLEKMRMAYAHAIENQYRFYSYGDACLLLGN